MKGELSKEHYGYKIRNKKQCLPPSIDNPNLHELRTHFYKKILIPSSRIFQKSQPPLNKGRFTLCIPLLCD